MALFSLMNVVLIIGPKYPRNNRDHANLEAIIVRVWRYTWRL